MVHPSRKFVSLSYLCFSLQSAGAVTISGYQDVPVTERSLRAALSQQPVSVGIDVEESFMLYKEVRGMRRMGHHVRKADEGERLGGLWLGKLAPSLSQHPVSVSIDASSTFPSSLPTLCSIQFLPHPILSSRASTRVDAV